MVKNVKRSPARRSRKPKRSPKVAKRSIKKRYRKVTKRSIKKRSRKVAKRSRKVTKRSIKKRSPKVAKRSPKVTKRSRKSKFSMNSLNFCNKYRCNSEETIKKCYRRTSLRLHPDKGGSEEAFKKLGNDYNSVENKLNVCPVIKPLDTSSRMGNFPSFAQWKNQEKPMPKRTVVKKPHASSRMGNFTSFAQDTKTKQRREDKKHEEKWSMPPKAYTTIFNYRPYP